MTDRKTEAPDGKRSKRKKDCQASWGKKSEAKTVSELKKEGPESIPIGQSRIMMEKNREEKKSFFSKQENPSRR